MRSFRKVPLLILLTLTLTASPALAAGGRGPHADRAVGLLSSVWQIWGELASWVEKVQTGDRGSAMDPNG